MVTGLHEQVKSNPECLIKSGSKIATQILRINLVELEHEAIVRHVNNYKKSLLEKQRNVA